MKKETTHNYEVPMNGTTRGIFKQNDLMNPGHLGCPGCGATIAMKFALQALGEKTMVVIPACCASVINAYL